MDNQDLIKKISYIRGLSDGLKLSDKSDEGHITVKLIDVIESMAETISELKEMVDELDDSLCEISDDVDELYDLYDGGDIDFGSLYDDEDGDDMDFDDDEEDDSELFELECPNCGEDVMIDFDMLDDGNLIICPNCHKEIELEIDYDCDCGCHDHDDEDEE